MIKKAYPSGLMYLCQTKQEPYSYKGSGTRWTNHIKRHKSHIITCIIGEYETMEELREAGIRYSRELNVVESEEWANLREEDGTGGGSGKVGRRWKIKDTSKMRGPKRKRKGDPKYQDCLEEARKRMLGANNPRNRFPATEKQKEAWKNAHQTGTEASKKQVLVVEPNGSKLLFESKRAVCHYLNISYDVLNYRIDTERDYNGYRFLSEKNDD